MTSPWPPAPRRRRRARPSGSPDGSSPGAARAGRAAALVAALLLTPTRATPAADTPPCPEVAVSPSCHAGSPISWPHPAGGTLLLCREGPAAAFRLVEVDDGCRIRLEGRVHRGLRDGLFRWRDAAGRLRREQVFRAGRATGPLRLFAGSGALELEAHLVDGVLEGPWKRFHPVPAGRAAGTEDPHPAETGSYRAGRRDGLFRRYDPDGHLLAEDTWRDGRLEGPWRRYHPDGRVAASGARRAGEPEGVVRRFDREGRLVEETTWRAGVLHGLHRRFASSGAPLLEETWRRGRLHGVRRVWDEAGRLRREERYREGELDGVTRLFAPEGHLREEIHYRRGRRHGPTTLWHGPGRAALVGQYEDGRPVGVFTEQDPSGRVSAVREYGGPCEGGGVRVYEATPGARAEWCQRTGPDGSARKHGPWALYAPPGNPAETPPPEPGVVPDGWWTCWRERGPLLERGHYRDGRLDGPFERFAPDGTKLAEGRYADGRREGRWTFWHPNGALAERGTWKGGVRHGFFVQAGGWGAGIAEGEYRDGRRVGRWRFRPSDHGPARIVVYTPAGDATP